MPEVWKRLGDTPILVDPFLGSNAPLLSRPGWDWQRGQWTDGKNRMETINDKNMFVANFWRAINADPSEVAHWADWPVNEADLHARHLWLVQNDDFLEKMKTDPDYYDAKVAGWWVWGLCQWIAVGWCDTLAKKRPHFSIAGMGIHRPAQKLPHLSNPGIGVHRPRQRRFGEAIDIYEYFDILATRLRRVRVCCGDWTRVLGRAHTYMRGQTAIILDPPYGFKANRKEHIYSVDSLSVADQVRKWAIEHGDNPGLRIALFGYEDEHSDHIPANWEMFSWSTNGGYSNRNATPNPNKYKERIWFSPHCLKPETARQMELLKV